MKRLCNTCPTRRACRKLCRRATEYVSQDYIGQKEKLVGLIKYTKESMPTFPSIYLTGREKEILTLLGKGLTRADVCQVLNISRGTLRFHIYNLRRKTNEFNY